MGNDISGTFGIAKDKTIALILMYSKIKPVDKSLEYSLLSDPFDLNGDMEDFDFEPTPTISLDISNQFCRDADAYYAEAKWSTVSAIAQTPPCLVFELGEKTLVGCVRERGV